MNCPTTPEGWRGMFDKFLQKWNFPHTCRALDGNHVVCKCPPKSGSQYFNYKRFYSVVLMAFVDADYKFIWVQTAVVQDQHQAHISTITLKSRNLLKTVPSDSWRQMTTRMSLLLHRRRCLRPPRDHDEVIRRWRVTVLRNTNMEMIHSSLSVRSGAPSPLFFLSRCVWVSRNDRTQPLRVSAQQIVSSCLSLGPG